MQRNTPVRKPNNSTADLLTWSEIPPETTPVNTSAQRSHQVKKNSHFNKCFFFFFENLNFEFCIGFIELKF